MVFIISEIGVNWDGDFELAKEMIVRSRDAGCNAVKFQAYNEKIVRAHPQWKRLMNTTITKDNIETINDIAEAADIEWFCTPMYPDAVDLLNPFVKRFKIREFDGRELIENRETEISRRVLETKKPIIISSQKSPKNSIYHNLDNIDWLYCVPKYPCGIEDLDFTYLKDFDGFSNHSVQEIIPITAVVLGAKIVEIHITSNKSKDFVDNNVSFDYDQLRSIVKQVRLVEKIRR